MGLPKFTRMQWSGKGQHTLKFVKPIDKEIGNINNAENTTDYMLLKEENNLIFCHLSTLNIWEYVEKNQFSSIEEEDQELESIDISQDSGICLSKKIWNNWLSHWSFCEEHYVPMAWFQRFPDMCSIEESEWFKCCLKNNPELENNLHYHLYLAFNSERCIKEYNLEEKEELESVKLSKEDDYLFRQYYPDSDNFDFNKKLLLDVMYEEFKQLRYWVHFRAFLQDIGFTLTEELKQFFKQKGIIQDPPIAKVGEKIFPELDGFQKNKFWSEILDDQLTTNYTSNNDKVPTTQNSPHLEIEKENNFNISDDCSLDVKQIKVLSKNKSDNEVTIADNLNDSFIKDNIESKDLSIVNTEIPNSSCSDNASSTLKDGMMNIKSDKAAEPLIPTISDSNKKKNMNQHREIGGGTGIAWVLKHVKDINNRAESLIQASPENNLSPTEFLQSINDLSDETSSPREKVIPQCLDSLQNLNSNTFIKEVNTNNLNGTELTNISSSTTNELKYPSSSSESNTSIQSSASVISADTKTDTSIHELIEKSSLSHLSVNSRSVGEQDSEDLSPVMKDSSLLDIQTNDQILCAETNSAQKRSLELSDEECDLDYSSDKNDRLSTEQNEPNAVVIITSSQCGKRKRRRSSENITDEEFEVITKNTKEKEESIATNSSNKNGFVSNLVVRCLKLLNDSSSVIAHLPRAISSLFLFLIGQFGLLKPATPSVVSNTKKVVKNNVQEKTLRGIRRCMQPVIRSFPSSPVIPSEPDIIIGGIESLPDDRGKRDDLIETTLLEEEGENYVTFLNDEALDEVCEMYEDVNLSKEEHVKRTYTTFDDEGNPKEVSVCRVTNPSNRNYSKQVDSILRKCKLVKFSLGSDKVPSDIPEEVAKYWHQRHRLFSKFDSGIMLDTESWYSVTPEMIAAHQAFRCTCDTVIDAFCGAGGNAIQLTSYCNKVIAIDIDPGKIKMAKNNARVYGVEDKIQFIVGDFFDLAPKLTADVVFLSPPWGGMTYLDSSIYDVFKMDGDVDGRLLMEAAQEITKNVAIYLPKNSNIFQVAYLAGADGEVDIEYNHISNKRKALTAYYGDLVHYYPELLPR